MENCPPDTKAIIINPIHAKLSVEEIDLYASSKPLGFIVFAQHCENREQLKTLCADLRHAVAWNCPILIDEEGGRVQRLKPPEWESYPAPGPLSKDSEALRTVYKNISQDLNEVGINVNCAPVLDRRYEDTDNSIGDRAFDGDVEHVTEGGKITCAEMLQQKIMPVMKHLPGQGRAICDSHYDLPQINVTIDELKKHDFSCFANLPSKNKIWGMVAHVIYSHIDGQNAASVSATIIQDIIRDYIGFDGPLLSDDLRMQALKNIGGPLQRIHSCLTAGCDIALIREDDIEAQKDFLPQCPMLSPLSRERLERSWIW